MVAHCYISKSSPVLKISTDNSTCKDAGGPRRSAKSLKKANNHPQGVTQEAVSQPELLQQEAVSPAQHRRLSAQRQQALAATHNTCMQHYYPQKDNSSMYACIQC
jgi:hypothetical protein